MAGFLANPRGLKPVSKTGSTQISPTTVRAYIDPVNTLSLGNNEVVMLSPTLTNATSVGPLPGFIQARAGDTPTNGTLTPDLQLNAYGVLAGVEFEIPTYPGFFRGLFWKQGSTVSIGKQVTASIVNDPDIYYEIQTSDATGLLQNMIGKYCNLANINWIDNSANGASGISQGQSYTSLNISVLGVNPTDTRGGAGGLWDVQIIGLSPRPGNFFATTGGGGVAQPNNYAIVKLNSTRP